MLNLPIYLRGSTYYLHTRILGQQFKRSLHTADKQTAIIRASRLIESVLMGFDFSNVRKYELDIARGVAKADSPADHQNLMEAMKLFLALQTPASTPTPTPEKNPPSAPAECRPSTGLTLSELLDKYFLLKSVKPATVSAHKLTVKEFVNFFRLKCYISDILVSDITRYQEFLAKKGNAPRTIDSKVGYIKALLNFAIKQGYLLNTKNPAEGMTLLKKREKLKGGYLIFEPPEITNIYTGGYFKAQQETDPDYYYVLLLGLLTGCRVSELTSLTKSQVQTTQNGTRYIAIRDSKTESGKRDVPLPAELFDDKFNEFLHEKNGAIFKYAPRDGKGSGNAVGKKFARHLELLEIKRGKLVFHSLRKFTNDFFLKNGVEYEPRCQFFGHEIEAVNVATYSNEFNVDQLGEIVRPAQRKILGLIGY